MPNFESHFTDEQRDAICAYVLDTGGKVKRALELAAAGEIKWQGETLEPYRPKESTARTWLRREAHRRQGKARSKLTEMRNADGVEVLRRRLMAYAESELDRLERRQKPHSGRVANPLQTWEELRVVARALRELRSLPDPEDPRPASLGQQNPKTGKVDTHRITGLGADILKAARSNGAASPAQSEESTHTHGETDPRAAAA